MIINGIASVEFYLASRKLVKIQNISIYKLTTLLSSSYLLCYSILTRADPLLSLLEKQARVASREINTLFEHNRYSTSIYLSSKHSLI